MTALNIETLVRGTWTKLPYNLGLEVQTDDPDDVLHEACKLMAQIVCSSYPGSKVRIRWHVEGVLEPITLESSDAALDDYIVEERERIAAYAEEQKRIFREFT